MTDYEKLLDIIRNQARELEALKFRVDKLEIKADKLNKEILVLKEGDNI